MNNNYSMLLDLYEFTMSNGILHSDKKDTICYFDMFFRRVPDEGGFAIMAGLEQLIDYLKNLKFTKEDIEEDNKYALENKLLPLLKNELNGNFDVL